MIILSMCCVCELHRVSKVSSCKQRKITIIREWQLDGFARNVHVSLERHLVAKDGIRLLLLRAARRGPAGSVLLDGANLLDCDSQVGTAVDLAEGLVAVVAAVRQALHAPLLGAELERLHVAGLLCFAAVRLRVRGAGGAVKVVGDGVVFRLALGQAHNQRGHGHFNVEFDHVDDGVELDVDDGVLEEHEADEEDLGVWSVAGGWGVRAG
jgi:hypothetical protein